MSDDPLFARERGMAGLFNLLRAMRPPVHPSSTEHRNAVKGHIYLSF